MIAASHFELFAISIVLHEKMFFVAGGGETAYFFRMIISYFLCAARFKVSE